MASRVWLLYAAVTAILWGIWGAFIEIPEKAGFPGTLGYSVWALTMIPCALVALKGTGFAFDWDLRSVLLGSTIGLLGAGGQLLLFIALKTGPAYIVFPVVAMYPVITVLMSAILLRERTSRRSCIGIALALPAVVLLSYVPPGSQTARGLAWLVLAVFVAAAWGLQTYTMKFANRTMRAESIYVYMTATAVLLIPVAVGMTDFSRPVNWGFKGPYLAAAIQLMNSVGALTIVHALRYGKAIVVVPMTALAPMLTVIISLMLYRVIPPPLVFAGLLLAAIAIFLMAE